MTRALLQWGQGEGSGWGMQTLDLRAPPAPPHKFPVDWEATPLCTLFLLHANPVSLLGTMLGGEAKEKASSHQGQRQS